MLSYWLSWYLLPNDPEDSLNSYVFPLAIRLVKGERIVFAPIYLRSLFYRLDECVSNITRSTGRLYVVTLVDTLFLQLFLWEWFKVLGPKLAQYNSVEMIEVEDKMEK